MNERKLCGQCGRNRLLKFFAIRNRRTGLRQSWCRDCRRVYDKERYETADERARLVRKQAHIRARNRKFAFEYLAVRSCADCGEADPVVLEFDHISEKSFDVSRGVQSAYGIDRLLQEISKCEVVCANCHKRRTYARIGAFRVTGRDSQECEDDSSPEQNGE